MCYGCHFPNGIGSFGLNLNVCVKLMGQGIKKIR